MRTATEGVREASDKTEKELTAARDLMEEQKKEMQKAATSREARCRRKKTSDVARAARFKAENQKHEKIRLAAPDF